MICQIHQQEEKRATWERADPSARFDIDATRTCTTTPGVEEEYLVSSGLLQHQQVLTDGRSTARNVIQQSEYAAEDFDDAVSALKDIEV